MKEEKEKWLYENLIEKPELVAIREQMLPLTGGYSFSHTVHADSLRMSPHLDRYSVLEMLFRHLQSIGFYKTAEMLFKESGHEFIPNDIQSYDESDLRMLISLALGNGEDPWNYPVENDCIFVKEELEEDSYASSYTEPLETIWDEFFDENLNTIYHPNDSKYPDRLQAGTLKRLIVRLCKEHTSDGTNYLVTLPFITSSKHFFDHLMTLFYFKGTHPKLADYMKEKETIKKMRQSVFNLIKIWVKFQGLFIGKKCLNAIHKFLVQEKDNPDIHNYVRGLLEMFPNLSYGRDDKFTYEKAAPIIPTPEILFGSNVTLLHPDPTEVARQICLMAHSVYKGVHLRDVYSALKSKISIQTPTLLEHIQFEDRLANLFLSTILLAEKRNEAYEKCLIICSKLESLYNFGCLAAISDLLSREEIANIAHASADQRMRLNDLKERCEGFSSDGNKRPWQLVLNDPTKCSIPNIRGEIKAMSSIITSKEDFPDMINFEKLRMISSLLKPIYTFQTQVYFFYPIPQIQKVIKNGPLLSDQEMKEKITLLLR